MLDIPFALQTISSDAADAELESLRRQKPGITPVLLGDADVFSVEWAECVDAFDAPEIILDEARQIDIDLWFENRRLGPSGAEAQMNRSLKLFNTAYRVAAFPFDVALLPLRLARWPLTGKKPAFMSRSPFDYGPSAADETGSGIDALKAQLAELEASGGANDADLDEIRAVISELEAEGNAAIYPDPVHYVTPRHGDMIAAGLLETSLPWESAAWLQHGTYALCAPKPVFVAQCRWMWDRYGARPITASTDHIGFQLDQPIATTDEAQEVLRRFAILGATEINADRFGSKGQSLVGAPRLWIWWD